MTNSNITITTTTTNLFDSKSSSASTDISSPPVWPPPVPNISTTIEDPVATITSATTTTTTATTTTTRMKSPKSAMPPSFAESLRAVFAALLWHEGIVHDAMACASFLKFHPSLPKEGALVVTRRDGKENKISLSR